MVGVVVNFSAQTSSGRTQEIIESKLDKKRKTVLGEWMQGVSRVYSTALGT